MPNAASAIQSLTPASAPKHTIHVGGTLAQKCRPLATQRLPRSRISSSSVRTTIFRGRCPDASRSNSAIAFDSSIQPQRRESLRRIAYRGGSGVARISPSHLPDGKTRITIDGNPLVNLFQRRLGRGKRYSPGSTSGSDMRTAMKVQLRRLYYMNSLSGRSEISPVFLS